GERRGRGAPLRRGGAPVRGDGRRGAGGARHRGGGAPAAGGRSRAGGAALRARAAPSAGGSRGGRRARRFVCGGGALAGAARSVAGARRRGDGRRPHRGAPARGRAFVRAPARHGDGADAIEAYRRILGHPRVAADRRSRVEPQLLQLLVIVGDLDGARRVLPSLQDEPAPDTLIGLARLEEAADGYTAAAELWLRAAAQLEGQHAAAAELERARVCRLGGMHDEERAALTRAFALAPTGQDALAAASGL